MYNSNLFESYNPVNIHLWKYKLVQGWNYKNMMRNYWRCYMNFNQGADIHYENSIIRMAESAIYVIPPNIQFRVTSGNSFHQLFFHFSVNLDYRNPPTQIYELPATIFTPEYINEVIKSREEGQAGFYSAYGFLCIVISKLPKELFYNDNFIESRIGKAFFLMNNIATHYSNRQLAKAVNMSENAFIRLFSRYMGVSPQQYSRQQRIEYAKIRLSFTDDSLDDIAMTTGFADRYHFSRVFSKITSFTPAAYRKRQRAGSNIQ